MGARQSIPALAAVPPPTAGPGQPQPADHQPQGPAPPRHTAPAQGGAADAITFPFLQSPSSLISYFIPRPTPPFEHSHHRPSRPMELAILLRARGIPSYLIPRILDERDSWSVCWVKLTHPMAVAARELSPRMTLVPQIGGGRNIGGAHPVMAGSAGTWLGAGTVPGLARSHWRNGQEEELGWDPDRGKGGGLPGLEEGEGKAWFLVSGTVGCAQNPLEPSSATEQASKGGAVWEKLGADNSGLQHGNSGRRNAAWRPGHIREVVIETISRDQGWSSSEARFYGTYEQSYSWFEVSLLRNGEEVPDSREIIQHNVHAGQYFKSHRVVLGVDHPTVRLARPGDRIVLWVRAQFPGWVNNIREAAITIYSYPFPSEL